MKKLVITLTLVTLSFVSNSEAQITPDIDFKSPGNLISIKTDPVLKNPIDLFGVKTDPVLKTPTDLAGVKTDPVLSDPMDKFRVKTDPVLNQIDGLSLNFEPVLDLISHLEKSGAKVTYKLVESNGVTLLEVTVNGESMTPFVIGCKNCEPIVYEY